MTDLQDAYNDIHREFHRMSKAFLVLKRKNKSLEITVNSLSDELAEAKRLPKADIQGIPKWNPTSQAQNAAPIVARSLLKEIGYTILYKNSLKVLKCWILSHLCRCVSKHPTTASGTSIVDA